MWMAYSEATWPKAVDIRTAVERLQRQFDAISWDAMLSLNRMGFSPEECEELEIVEKRYFEAGEKCEQYLKEVIDLNTLKKYLVDVNLENYLPDLNKFVK